jgi:multiple sugar transport system substrate-binding protein
MRRKNNLFMSLIILVMASLVACSNPTITVSPSSSASTPSSSASASVVKLSGNISALIWLPDAPQLIQEWVKGYNAVNPDVKVDVQMMVGQGLAENIQPRIAANTLPDLFSTNVSELCSSIADKAMLADLGDTKSWNEQLDGIKTAWTSPKGVKFGISCGVASSLIYYNQDLFTKAGITTLPANWDEFLAACEKLKTAEDSWNYTFCLVWWLSKFVNTWTA